MNTGEMEAATPTEGAALAKVWNDLGPLIGFAIQSSGARTGIKLCNAPATGEAFASWVLEPGRADLHDLAQR